MVVNPPFAFCDGAIYTTVDLRVYRLSAVKKAAYRLAAQCTVKLGAPEGDTLTLTLLLDRQDEARARSVMREFFQELLDQELREHVADETTALRTLILAQAFSKTDLIQR
ncbi:MAG: His-Xaa-Ser system protein HxsD [Polyangiaceae bacterium]